LHNKPDNPIIISAIGNGAKSAGPQRMGQGRVMARHEMDDARIASATPTKPSFENFFDLGVMYSTGREVATDLIAAHKWFNLAAVEGNLEAATYRQEVAREMSPIEIAKAQRAAREWLRTH
jgi:TPR repeat protein